MSKKRLITHLVVISMFVFSLGSSVITAQSSGKLPDSALPGQTTTRVSVASDGSQAVGGTSWFADISGNGEYVVFSSYATNLVNGDSNGREDVFLHNTRTGATTLISNASDGTQGDNSSWQPSISSSGSRIAFMSMAENLVSGDTTPERDIFLHDISSGQTIQVSVSSTRVPGNDDSEYPEISANGRYIVFMSLASNLVAGDTNNEADIFLHDTVTGITSRVSVASNGTQGNSGSSNPAISADGRYIAFNSNADNLVSGDNNSTWDVFLHDVQTGQTTRISVTSGGGEANSDSTEPSISADGRYIAFKSGATNLISGDDYEQDIFLHDRQTGVTSLVSSSSTGENGNGYTEAASISSSGRYVVFESGSDNLVSGDLNTARDIFLKDTFTGKTVLISMSSAGSQGNDSSNFPKISGDGGYVVFYSDATNLVNGDTNGFKDVFLRKLIYFDDVPVDHWASSYIAGIADAGLTTGYPDGTYRPENPVTRAEMAVFLLNGMGITTPPINGSHPFTDIAGHWAENYIEELFDQGITGGYPDGTYRPENLVTRAEMAVFLLKGMAVSPPAIDGSHPFTDVAGHWSEIFIEELFDQGITGGYPDGTYRPENRVTRAEMAVFLVNAFNIPLP